MCVSAVACRCPARPPPPQPHLLPRARDVAAAVRAFGDEHKPIEIYVQPELCEELSEFKTWTPAQVPTLQHMIDMIIILGGDGSLLHVSSIFQECVPPVLAFNCGSLGFLTPFSLESDYRIDLESIFAAVGRESGAESNERKVRAGRAPFMCYRLR